MLSATFRAIFKHCDFLAPNNTNSKKSQFFNELKFQYILSLHPRELATCRFFTGVVASEWTLRYVLSEKKAMAWQQHSFESCGHDIRDRVSVYQCISYLDFRQELNLPPCSRISRSWQHCFTNVICLLNYQTTNKPLEA